MYYKTCEIYYVVYEPAGQKAKSEYSWPNFHLMKKEPSTTTAKIAPAAPRERKQSLVATKGLLTPWPAIGASQIHTSSPMCRVVSGKYRITKKRDRPLTYEMANPPHYIAHRKSWNSWNTSSLKDGLRRSETVVEDEFIRRFMTGTWHGLMCSEVIIKRQFNHIRVAAIVRRAVSPTKMYFLLGYTEELLANWLQCPVTLELQTVGSFKDVIFKYI